MIRRAWKQVQRTQDGVTQYGFKTAGVVDPLEYDLRWEAAATPVPDGFEPYMMYESYTGTRGAVGKGRWSQCYTCLEDFPISELTEYKGHLYCTKNKCNEDFL